MALPAVIAANALRYVVSGTARKALKKVVEDITKYYATKTKKPTADAPICKKLFGDINSNIATGKIRACNNPIKTSLGSESEYKNISLNLLKPFFIFLTLRQTLLGLLSIVYVSMVTV